MRTGLARRGLLSRGEPAGFFLAALSEDRSIPVHSCTSEDGRPGYQWGNQTCYPYAPNNDAARREAKRRAFLQGAAITAAQGRRTAPKKEPAPLLFAKEFTPVFRPQAETDLVLLAKIQTMSLEPVDAEAVYIVPGHLANDQYDRSFERFPLAYLQRFAETIPGKSLLAGHDRSQLPLGRWIEGRVEPDSAGVQHLAAPFYVDAASDVARRLRMGIAKHLSISFRAAGRTCDLCGQSYDMPGKCEHVKGETYDGKVCTVTYSGDPAKVEAVEGSLVWLGCQHGAQTVRGKAWLPGAGLALFPGGEEETMETGELADLKQQAADGAAYHGYLQAEIARKLSAAAGKAEERDMILKTLEGANLKTLQDWDKYAQDRFDEKFPPQPSSKQLGEGGIPAPPQGVPPPPGRGVDPFASLRGRRED